MRCMHWCRRGVLASGAKGGALLWCRSRTLLWCSAHWCSGAVQCSGKWGKVRTGADGGGVRRSRSSGGHLPPTLMSPLHCCTPLYIALQCTAQTSAQYIVHYRTQHIGLHQIFFCLALDRTVGHRCVAPHYNILSC